MAPRAFVRIRTHPCLALTRRSAIRSCVVRDLRMSEVRYVTRGRGRIGTVEAAISNEAIKIAIREYGIRDPERQRRLVAQRIEG